MLVPPSAPPPLKGPSVSAPRVVGTLPMGVGSAFHPSPFWLKPSEHRLQHRASSTEPPATDSAAMHSASQSSRTPIPVPTPEPTPDGIFGRTPTPPPPPRQTPELFGGKGGCFDGGKGGCFDGGKGDKSGKGGCFDGGMGDKSGEGDKSGKSNESGPYGKTQQQQLIKQLLHQQLLIKHAQEREMQLEQRVYHLEGQVNHLMGQVTWMLSTLDQVFPLPESHSRH